MLENINGENSLDYKFRVQTAYQYIVSTQTLIYVFLWITIINRVNNYNVCMNWLGGNTFTLIVIIFNILFVYILELHFSGDTSRVGDERNPSLGYILDYSPIYFTVLGVSNILGIALFIKSGRDISRDPMCSFIVKNNFWILSFVGYIFCVFVPVMKIIIKILEFRRCHDRHYPHV